MSKYQKTNILSGIVILITIAFGLSLKNSLPEVIPTKFDQDGVAIAFAPFILSVFFMPILGTLAITVLTYLSKANKVFWNKENNREAVAQTNLGILLLIASMYVGTFLTALNFNLFFKISYFAIGFGLFFLISATAMKKIEKNLLYGIRLPWTMKSENNWKKTHELTSILMLISGVLLVVLGAFTKNHTLIFSLISVTFLVPTLYSFKIRKAL